MTSTGGPGTPASRLTYPELGATRRWPLPGGYHQLRVRTAVGHGPAVFERAGQAVLDWRMHRAVGVSIRSSEPVATPGRPVVVGLGVGRLRLRAPCEVVWTVADGSRTGFGYGTLPGHPECGEESFVVGLESDDSVVLTVTAFSRPVAWYTRMAGPLVPVLQRAYARRCGRVLRRLAAA
ncbi:DUF1990 family protein [Streptomyces coffeae]|uniref:DUF1990 domain-containing protein n=1 Tax=Streptomyces coffeae TaxID=621382 RepID=A0ABS1NLI6_9ACTN|nr:DUF1990 domain-containing protein [Streptomyces coffeae]MBL1100631.1 DUF1990 domain-containing protein [Streptomyces coffeae]